jgi:hypothetical protein
MLGAERVPYSYRKGGWAVAQSPPDSYQGLGTTVTVKRLKLRGYMSLSELYNSLETSNYKVSLFPTI